MARSVVEKCIVAAFLLAAGYLSVKSIEMGIGSFRVPGSGLFPLLVCLLLGLFSVLSLIQPAVPQNDFSIGRETGILWRISLVLVVAIAAGYSIGLLGFPATSFLVVVILHSVIFRMGLRSALLLGVIVTTSAFFLFRALGIVLPAAPSWWAP